MIRKIISIVLCIFMVGATVIPQKNTPVYAFSNITNENETEEDKKVYPTTSDEGFDIANIDLEYEEVSMRTPDSKTFKKIDGTYLMAVYGSAIHYEKNGELVDIDNSLIFDKSTGNYENQDNKYKIKLPKEINDNKKFKLSLDDYQIDWTISGIEAVEIAYLDNISDKNELKELDYINQRVVYSNIQDNVDLEYILSGNSIKENIILDKYIKDFSMTFTYTVKNLDLVQDSSGSYVFINNLGEVIFYMNSFYMFDSEGLDSEAITIRVNEIKKDEYQINIIPDNEYLKAASYPVTIDPTLVYENGTSIIQDKYVYSTYSTSNSYLKAGYRDAYSYYYRSYMEFDLTELESDIKINYAYLSLSTYNNVCTSDITIVANEVKESYSYNGINQQLLDVVEDRPLDYFHLQVRH